MSVISCVMYSALSLNFILGELHFRKALSIIITFRARCMGKRTSSALTTDKKAQHLDAPNKDGCVSDEGDEAHMAKAAD